MSQMHNDNHENPVVSILCGSIFAIFSYLQQNDFIIDFGLDLLKVCLFGFAGGIFGLIGRRFWSWLWPSKKNTSDEL